MKNSKDLALIIMFAVLNLVLMILIGQVPELITGIPAIGYAFIIFYAITQSVAILMYEGRRWRLVMQAFIFNTMALLSVATWTQIAALVSLISSIIVDVVFNSLYGYFKRKDKLLWFAVVTQVYSWTSQPIWTLLFVSLFLSPFESVLRNWFIPIILVVLPVIIVEAIAGGYIGYKTYERVKRIQN